MNTFLQQSNGLSGAILFVGVRQASPATSEPGGDWSHVDTRTNVTYPMNDTQVHFAAGEPVCSCCCLLHLVLTNVEQSGQCGRLRRYSE